MSTTPFSVSGKTAIVTGAGSGICLAFASLLLSRGCNVVLADLALRPEAQALVSAHTAAAGSPPPRAVFVETDVRSWAALARAQQRAVDEFGGFDVLCPGAGVYEPHWSSFWHPPGSPASRDGDDDRYALLDINLAHPLRATQLALSHWLHPPAPPAGGSGGGPETAGSSRNRNRNRNNATPRRVVHISSVAAQRPNLAAPLYAASKSAITGFVRCLAGLEASHGVRVNAVAPGVVRTPLWTEHPEKLVYVDAERDGWVTPEEVAAAMLRCVEDDAVPGGSVLEVGKGCTRLVQTYNDPGPDVDPARGLVTRNGDKGVAAVNEWLADETIWGPPVPYIQS
ncbi:short-chain dehydrogenase [Biscogniauxia mediterranea]|nr:short-chain dehydrogenase [Biscogniauxia mediterranea]